MADPVTLAALSGSADAIGRIGKELAKNEKFAEQAGESIKLYTDKTTNISQTLAYAFEDIITKNAEIYNYLSAELGKEFVDNFLKNPDIAAKKYADAVPYASKSAKEIMKIGKDAVLFFPKVAKDALFNVAQLPGTFWRGVKQGFTGPEEPEMIPQAPPGYVVYKQGGDEEMTGIRIALMIVFVIFIIALIYWLVNNGHKKNVNMSGRITGTEGILLGTGFIIILLSIYTFIM